MSTERVSYDGLGWPQTVVVLLYLGAAAIYLHWRLGTFNPHAFVFSMLLYAAEAFGVVTALLHLLMTWRLTNRTAPEPQPGLTVDVFIPTFNEPVDVVRRTAIAALAMDYSKQVWVLDDGNRPQMRGMAAELGCRYLARIDNTHAKAGNLNNALAHSTGEFIAIFDADHAPAKHFLTETLGYFQDTGVAFVQTPQDFFNLDSYQHRHSHSTRVWTEQSLFFRVIQRGKDYWNAAFFCGSCAIIRRSALDTIGGFATGTITEDLHTSLKLHKAGFRSVYHATSLAFGIAPANVVPFLKQRIRWGQGAMQVWRREGILFTKGLTLVQRLNYLGSVLTYFEGWQKAFFYVAPIIVLTTGWMPISTFSTDFLRHFIPYFLLTFWVFEEVGRGFGRTYVIEQYNFARFWAFAWATLGIFRESLQFKVTPKLNVPQQYGFYMIPQATILLLSILAVPVGIVLYYKVGTLSLNGLVANTIWANVNAALALSVLVFTRATSALRRRDYRFPIALPARVRIGDSASVYGTVDDISSSGLRLYAMFPENVARGDSLEGTLYLPSGPACIKAEVTSIVLSKPRSPSESAHVNTIGCRFTWDNAKDRDQLDLFLYGTDLQWQLLSLNEQTRTPLQFLSDLFAGRLRRVPESQSHQHWAPAIYRLSQPYVTDSSKDLPRVGLITAPAEGPRRFLAFNPLPVGQSLKLAAITRRHIQLEKVTLSAEVVYDTSAGKVYAYAADVEDEAVMGSSASEAAGTMVGDAQHETNLIRLLETSDKAETVTIPSVDTHVS